MKIKRIITVSATALALAGLGTFVNNTNKASASQPVRVFRQTNGRNNHGYYGFYYAKNMEDIGSKIHYQKGLLPRNLRKRNRYVSIWDPAVKAESPTIKKGRSRYYIDDLDTSQRLSHGKYYQNVLINTNDVHGISNRQDRSLLKSIKSQYKRNQRVIKRHRHNHKLVDRLEDRNSFLQIKLNTDNTNNRMRMDPKRKHKTPVKRRAHRHYRKARKHYAKYNVQRNKKRIRKSHKRVYKRKAKSKIDATHKYLVGSNAYDGQIIDNSEFNDFMKDNGYSASGGNDGDLVHITNRANVAGKVFYQIKDPDGDDGWIYSGDLSNKPNGKAYPIDIGKFDDRSVKASISSKVNQNARSDAQQEIGLINQDRADHGKAPLQESQELDRIAQMGAERLANGAKFGHKDPNNNYINYYAEDAQRLGYNNVPNKSLGENADAGSTTPEEANKALYTNEEPYNGGHYQNIISETPNEYYTEVGVGVASNPNSKYGTYWVEDFKNGNENY